MENEALGRRRKENQRKKKGLGSGAEEAGNEQAHRQAKPCTREPSKKQKRAKAKKKQTTSHASNI